MARQFIEKIKRLLHFIQYDLWRLDLVHNSRLHAFGIETLRVFHLVLKGVKEDNCRLHASALTYSMLMALVPFLVILFSIGKAIGFTKAEEIILSASAELPEGIQNFIYRLLEIVEGVNPAGLGAVGGVFLLAIIFKLLSGIEESFNQIWGVQSSRGILDKVRNYLSVLVIAPVLMLVGNAGSVAVAAFIGTNDIFGPVFATVMQLAPVFVLALAFVAVFIFLPNTKVSFRAAATGGVVSAVMVLILLQIFVIKFGGVMFKKYAIYGSFASIPIFLFWIYLNWTILLFGAELAFAMQNRRTYAEEQAAVRASMMAKLWVAFSVMQRAVHVFQGAEDAWDVTEYAREKNIPSRLMNEVIGILCRAHLLGAVASDGQNNYALLQAPENVTAKKIYDLMITDGASPSDLGLADDGAAHEMLGTIDSSLGRTLGSITLFQFME